ncbi:MAG: TonB-dependent receptor [Pseudomonadota bacterium]
MAAIGHACTAPFNHGGKSKSCAAIALAGGKAALAPPSHPLANPADEKLTETGQSDSVTRGETMHDKNSGTEKRRAKSRNAWLSGASLIIMAVAFPPALAQAQQASGEAAADDASGLVLEEIIVTSRRYAESLQDVPVSVNAMSNEYLRKQGISTVNDVIEFSPGSSFVRFNKMQHEYSMRGISSQSEGSSGDSSVQTVVDNVVVSKDFMKNPAMFDVERVEVLRGPQGTSFGRNASAGLVHIVTKRPTEDFEAGLIAEAGSFATAGLEGYLSGPLSDKLAARLAFNFDRSGGYTKRISTGERLGGEQNYAIRGSLLFTPNDSLSVYLKAEYSKDDDETPIRRSADCSFPTLDGSGATVPSPPHPPWKVDPSDPNSAPFIYTDPCNVWRTEISNGDFFLKRDILNLTGEIVWQFGDGLSLTSVTGYLDGSNNYLIEANGTPKNVMFQANQNDAYMFSEELRVDNHGSGNRFRWLAGIYYLTDSQDRFDENQFFQDNALPPPRVPTKATRINSNKTDSLGLFGELTYDVTERLTGTFGMRYSRDQKDYQAANFGFGWAPILEGFADCTFSPPDGLFNCGTEANPVGLTTPIPASDSWDNVSVKASAQYAFTDHLMGYALYSQGYKTGGFQSEPFLLSDATTPFNEEKATNYEIGFKGDFARRFRLNVSAFYIEYKNLQVLQFQQVGDGFSQITTNIKGANIYGLEAETTWQVTENFRLTGSFALLDAGFANGTLVTLDMDQGPIDIGGTRPDNAAKWTGTLVAEYDINLEDGSLITLRGDWRGRGDVYDDIGQVEERRRPGVNKLGVRVSWLSANDQWTVAAWGRNLTNEEDIINVGPPQPNNIQRPVAFAAPRSWGISISRRF